MGPPRHTHLPIGIAVSGDSSCELAGRHADLLIATGSVRQARELADVPSGRAVFVGDTVRDMKAAVRDGVVPVAVLSGGNPRTDLETAGARAVYRDPADLLGHLDSGVHDAGRSASSPIVPVRPPT